MAFVFPSTVRNQILAQHEELREFTHRTAAEAAGGPSQLERLTRLAREIHRRFHDHLLFEEQALVPVLWAVDGWGPERVRELRSELARQRRELDEVLNGLESGWTGERVALELNRLADHLLKDMAEKEVGCLRASLLSDGCLSYERH
jgi:hypothetical protein